MPRSYYTPEEDRLRSDIGTLRRMLSDVVVHSAPCPLALIQLDEMRVLTEKLNSTARKLHAAIREAGHARPGE